MRKRWLAPDLLASTVCGLVITVLLYQFYPQWFWNPYSTRINSLFAAYATAFLLAFCSAVLILLVDILVTYSRNEAIAPPSSRSWVIVSVITFLPSCISLLLAVWFFLDIPRLLEGGLSGRVDSFLSFLGSLLLLIFVLGITLFYSGSQALPIALVLFSGALGGVLAVRGELRLHS